MGGKSHDVQRGGGCGRSGGRGGGHEGPGDRGGGRCGFGGRGSTSVLPIGWVVLLQNPLIGFLCG